MLTEVGFNATTSSIGKCSVGNNGEKREARFGGVEEVRSGAVEEVPRGAVEEGWRGGVQEGRWRAGGTLCARRTIAAQNGLMGFGLVAKRRAVGVELWSSGQQ